MLLIWHDKPQTEPMENTDKKAPATQLQLLGAALESKLGAPVCDNTGVCYTSRVGVDQHQSDSVQGSSF